MARFVTAYPQYATAVALHTLGGPNLLNEKILTKTASWRAIHLAEFDPFLHGSDRPGHPPVQFTSTRAAA